MKPQFELFFGSATPAEARVYARIDLAMIEHPRPEMLRLQGRLVGPECAFARTLPSHIPFTNRTQGATLLAEAIIPDPCFWTPDLPFLYRAELELRDDHQTLANCNQIVGVRRLAVRDRSLHFDAKRFVLRGVRFENLDPTPGATAGLSSSAAAFARESCTALVVQSPSDELCDFATHRGILLVADLTTVAGVYDPGPQLRILSQSPAVGIAMLPVGTPLPANIHTTIPNLLLAEYIPHNHPLPLSPWAQLAFIEAINPIEFAQKITGCNLPIIAVRSSPQPTTIEQARAACDKLQSELSPHGDFAGYVV